MSEYIEREKAEELLSQPITMSMCLTREECLAKRSQRDIDVSLIHAIPAADVRPVVLCRDCKYWVENGTDYCSCDRDALLRERDFFCAAGEKREES